MTARTSEIETVSQDQPAEPALVLFALADERRARSLCQSLAVGDLSVRTQIANTCKELEAAAHEEHPALIVAAHELADGDALKVLKRLRQESMNPPRCVAVFDDQNHPAREVAARNGIIDFVHGATGADQPLLALVGRLITRDVLEARLDATTLRFRALVENSNDGIYILRAGEFAYVNPRFEQLVGYGAIELLSPKFSIGEHIIAEESRGPMEDRRRRVEAGLAVEPRYEFVARRKDGSKFDAEVSVSYIEFEGAPATLGIMQDITERKQFEKQLVRKNRELALLNDLATSINDALRLDDILRIGCHRVFRLLRVAGTGIVLLAPDGKTIELMVAEGLTPEVEAELRSLDVDSPALIARAVREGQVEIVEDVKTDPRIAVESVRKSGFEGALVVPMKSRDRILGAAFVFSQPGRSITEADEELMRSFGVLLGTAVEKASLLEQERTAVQRLRALDAVAVAVSSSLDTRELAETVAESVHQLYEPTRVCIAEYDESCDCFRPMFARDYETDVRTDVDIPASVKVLSRMLETKAPVQDVCTEEDRACFVGEKKESWSFLSDLGALVAVPVLSEGEVVGVIALGYQTPRPLEVRELESLSTLSTHVSIALKNAALFAARNQALEDLRTTQAKLVKSEKLRALGELAAGVAHDFNNVLGAILGRVQLLKTQAREPTIRHHAIIIEKAATDGAETVRRIQELGRQDTTNDFVTVRVEEILDDVAELTKPRWRDKTRIEGRPVDLEVDVVDDLWVLGNPHELREVLINLVNNAVDALPEGGGVLLSARLYKGQCEIAISDNGTGMPDDVAARIFDPFFTTKGEQGTGLGLSVSYSIIRRHGGEIEVESSRDESGHGTTFYITLPVIDPPDDLEHREPDPLPTHIPRPVELSDPRAVLPVAEAEVNDDPAPAAPSADEGAEDEAQGDEDATRILVIDDEENIRDILTDILSIEGYEVVCVGTGKDGLARLGEGRFDMVLTDLGLPGMTGYEVADAAKARFPQLPVGLVTGWGANLDKNRAREHGIDLVLSKPFRFDQVLESVRETLKSRQS